MTLSDFRLTITEFVERLQTRGIEYKSYKFQDATYIEVEDDGVLYGFRFNHRNNRLSGGWIHPSQKANWQIWGEYLQ